MKKKWYTLIVAMVAFLLPIFTLVACGDKPNTPPKDPSGDPPPVTSTSFHNIYSDKKSILEQFYGNETNTILAANALGEDGEPSNDSTEEENTPSEETSSNPEENNPSEENPTNPEENTEEGEENPDGNPETDPNEGDDGNDTLDDLEQPEDDYSEPGITFSYYCHEDANEVLSKYLINPDNVYSCITYNDELVCVEFYNDISMQELVALRKNLEECYQFYNARKDHGENFANYTEDYFRPGLFYYINHLAFINEVPISAILGDEIEKDGPCYIAKKSHTLLKFVDDRYVPEDFDWTNDELRHETFGGSYTLPEGIETIASQALVCGDFYYEKLILPSTVRVIEDHALYVPDIELNDGLEFIGDYGIEGLSHTPQIPSSVTYIGAYGIFNRAEFYGINQDSFYIVDNWILYSKFALTPKALHIPEGIVGIAKLSLLNSPTKYYIPESVEYICYNFATGTGHIGLFFEADSMKDGWTDELFVTSSFRDNTRRLHIYYNYTEADEEDFENALNRGGRTICDEMDEYYCYGPEHNTDTLYIDADVEFIAQGLYYTEVEQIIVDPDNPYYCSVDGVMYSKDMKTLICVPSARKKPYSIPETVTGIYNLALNNFYVHQKYIFIPKEVVSFGWGIFYFWDTTCTVYFETKTVSPSILFNDIAWSCSTNMEFGVTYEEYLEAINTKYNAQIA